MNADEPRIRDLAEKFQLMGDRNRLRILLLVLDRPRAVGEAAAATGLSASLVSHNLGRLRAARPVAAERRGKRVIYAVADAHVLSVLRDMLDHVSEVDLLHGVRAGA